MCASTAFLVDKRKPTDHHRVVHRLDARRRPSVRQTSGLSVTFNCILNDQMICFIRIDLSFSWLLKWNAVCIENSYTHACAHLKCYFILIILFNLLEFLFSSLLLLLLLMMMMSRMMMIYLNLY